MKLRAIRIGLTLLGNALGLLIAGILLGSDMDVSGAAFVIAVAIFTVLTLGIEPLVSKVTAERADFLSGGADLITTALALIITALISDGLSIDGIGTWLLATVIVWLATAILGVVLARIFLKDAAKGSAAR